MSAEQHDLLVRIDLLRVQGPVDWGRVDGFEGNNSIVTIVNTIVTIRLFRVWVLITPAALDLS